METYIFTPSVHLHARPLSLISHFAQKIEEQTYLSKKSEEWVSCKSVLSLMLLGIQPWDTLEFYVETKDTIRAEEIIWDFKKLILQIANNKNLHTPCLNLFDSADFRKAVGISKRSRYR